MDLIEEVVRTYGIGKIPSARRSQFTPVSAADLVHDREANLRRLLTAQGLTEARTSALVPRGQSLFNPEAYALRNPLSEDHVAMRPSLLPGSLAVLARNLRGGERSIRLFELGRTFSPADGDEVRRIGFVLCGQTTSSIAWRGGSPRHLDLFDAKGVIDSLGSENLVFRRGARSELALSAELSRGDEPIGFVGQLHAADATALGASAPVIVGEILLRPLLDAAAHPTKFSELQKFPAITRDIALLVPEGVSHAAVEACFHGAAEPLLARVELFDVFSGKAGDSPGSNRRSLAYTLTYRDKNRTLTNDEINVIHTRIRERIQRDLAAELRE